VVPLKNEFLKGEGEAIVTIIFCCRQHIFLESGNLHTTIKSEGIYPPAIRQRPGKEKTMSAAATRSCKHHRQLAWQLATRHRRKFIVPATPHLRPLRRGFVSVASSTTSYWTPSENRASQISSNLSPSNLQHRLFHATLMIPKDYPLHTMLPFPALSPTMEFGTIVKWEIQEGEAFSAGSVLCSIETDKATMDFESQDDGILAKILKQGSNAVDLPIGSPIAVVVEDMADVASFADFVLEESQVALPIFEVKATAEASVTAPTAKPLVGGGSTGTSILLPSARFLAESK
jgi:hypothetical protein